eukprot:scaffold154_cov129-Cylindrotheca_fusiformis.AAC.22
MISSSPKKGFGISNASLLFVLLILGVSYFKDGNAVGIKKSPGNKGSSKAPKKSKKTKSPTSSKNSKLIASKQGSSFIEACRWNEASGSFKTTSISRDQIAPAEYIGACIEDDFVRNTLVIDEPKLEGSEVEESYAVRYSITFLESGIVGLAGSLNVIERVTCSPGSVEIVFNNPIGSEASLAEMFPESSVLAVSGALFGRCNLGPNNLADESIASGFLAVHSAEMTDINIVRVSGDQVTINHLFQERDIVYVTAEERRKLQSKCDSAEEILFPYSRSFLPPPFEVTLNTTVTVSMGVQRVKDYWRLIGERWWRWDPYIDYEIDLLFGIDATVTATWQLDETSVLYKLPDRFKERDFVPFFPFPNVGFRLPKKVVSVLEKLLHEDDKDDFTNALGLGFTMPAVFDTELQSNAKVTLAAGVKASTGCVLGTWTLNGKPDISEPGLGLETDFTISKEPTTLEPIQPSINVVAEYTFTTFAGVKPQIIFDIFGKTAFSMPNHQQSLHLTTTFNGHKGLGSASIGFNSGLSVDVKLLTLDLALANYYPPIADVAGCEECHRSEVDIVLHAIKDPFFKWTAKGFEVGNINLPISPRNMPLAKFCQLDDEEATCGKTCCQPYVEICSVDSFGENAMCSDRPSVSPVPSQTPSSSPSPMQNPTPTFSPTPPVLSTTAGAFGDPHLTTFDGKRYDCQAAGDFVLTKSLDSQMAVHGRFKKKGRLVTLLTAVAATSGAPGSPIVEIQISEDAGREVVIYFNGIEIEMAQNVGVAYEDEKVRISKPSAEKYSIFFKDTSVEVESDLRSFQSFPLLNTVVKLPVSLRGQAIVGLLGSSNDNPADEWMDASGSPVDSSSISEYEYCSTYWCLRNEADSLFTYSDEYPFDYHFYCDDPAPEDVDTSLASAEIRELCGLDRACIIDGMELGIGGAQNALEAQSQLAERFSSFRFFPATVQAGTAANIFVTVDASSLVDAASYDSLNVYRIDSDTLEPTSGILLSLVDDGIGTDQSAGDLVFSNVLALLSSTAGESFSYRAVPVIAGVEFPSLQVSSLNAVLSFSVESGIGSGGTFAGTLRDDSIDNLFLVVRYSWPLDQRDLDTSTSFFGSFAGFGCSGSPYIQFSGDNTGNGGSEETAIDLGRSNVDGILVDTARVGLRAGWYDSGSSGPASVILYTYKRIDGNNVQSNNSISFAILPGRFASCDAKKVVGYADIVIDSMDGGVAIEVVSIE